MPITIFSIAPERL